MRAGRLRRAWRIREGIESDDYLCLRFHRFGIDYRRGPASEPQWPPTRELKEAAARIRADLRGGGA